MTKEIALRALEELPDSFEVSELIERLLFIAGVEEGLKDLEDNNVHDQHEIESMVEAWRK